MYETHYGFSQKPFSMTPDPGFLYLSKGHRTALDLLEYGVSEPTGFIIISGEVGSGKTILLRQLMNKVRDELTVGLITNTHRSFGELLKWILLAFDLKHDLKDQVDRHQALVDFLIDQYASNKRTVVIVDEAQNLGSEALEELRMLSNINQGGAELLQLILVGQPELREKLKQPELRQFAQRIALDYHLEPLLAEETGEYIRHRVKLAGGDPLIFEEEACNAVHFYAYGVPRLINVLCDLALVCGFADDKSRIDIDTIIEVVEARRRTGLAPFRPDPPGLANDDVRKLIRKSCSKNTKFSVLRGKASK